MAEPRKSDGSSAKKTESRRPFLFKVSSPDSACYRFIKELHPTPYNEYVQMCYIHGTARCSLCKCSSGSKNTERIFTQGDTVDIVWPIASDPSAVAKRNDDWMVWIVVTRLKHEAKTMWRRPLSDVLGRLKEYEIKYAWEEVLRHGVLPKSRNLSHSMKCVCVAPCGTQKLWIEEGTFPQQQLPRPPPQQPPLLFPQLLPIGGYWYVYGNEGNDNDNWFVDI